MTRQNNLSIRVLSVVLCTVLIAAMALSMTACTDNNAPAGAVTFTFQVADGNGKQTDFTITTEKATVGEALLDEGLIKGEDGPYGLYVKEVNGITADYDVDGTYWAFYVNGEMAPTGVDSTAVEDGAVYAFKVEK
ncbi:MAG: DUF4430 domain-containing protein [Clostridia bacterium]|nr:DUF4430 domain-containing protein [Clostridia bacterium]